MFPSSAAVAQVTVNHLVVGSNPTSGATFKLNMLNNAIDINYLLAILTLCHTYTNIAEIID